jgi:hypothetical protein
MSSLATVLLLASSTCITLGERVIWISLGHHYKAPLAVDGTSLPPDRQSDSTPFMSAFHQCNRNGCLSVPIAFSTRNPIMQARFIKTLLLLVAGAIATSCTQSLSQTPHNQPSPISPMSLNSSIIINQVTLQVREKKPPDGVMPKGDREVGFADVFLSIENLKQEQINLVVKQIQILNASTNQVQLTTQHPTKTHLQPLESSVNDFHLTNQTGFKGSKSLKAVITYQVGNQTQIMESNAVEGQ